MRASIGVATLSVLAAMTVTFYSSPASAAEQYRSFYQNAGASCHGINSTNDNRLSRTAQRLRNTSNYPVTVICNLMTDAYAIQGRNTYDVVVYVAQWAFRYQDRADNGEMSCSLITSFATDATAGAQGNKSETVTRSVTFTPADTNQEIFEWYRGQDPGDDLTARYRGPVNLSCIMPPKTELHDALVVYTTP